MTTTQTYLKPVWVPTREDAIIEEARRNLAQMHIARLTLQARLLRFAAEDWRERYESMLAEAYDHG